MKGIAKTFVSYCGIRSIIRMFIVFVLGGLIAASGLVIIGAVIMGVSVIGMLSNMIILAMLGDNDNKKKKGRK